MPPNSKGKQWLTGLPCDHPLPQPHGDVWKVVLHFARLYRQMLEKKTVSNQRPHYWPRQHLEVTIRLLSKWNSHFMLYVIITTGKKWIFLAQINWSERCPTKIIGKLEFSYKGQKQVQNYFENYLTQVCSLSISPLRQMQSEWAGPCKTLLEFMYLYL